MSKFEEKIFEIIQQLREEIRMNDQRIKKLYLGLGSNSINGDMLKLVYDSDNNGIVDNAQMLGGKFENQLNVDKVDGYHASAFALVSHTHPGSDITSIVANSERIGGRKIYVSDNPPQPGQGSDGDIWIEY